ncbi:MAG: hypothetical protein QOF48_3565 [Verrucomicrobiota bacterium]|jgi:hypothetical protein
MKILLTLTSITLLCVPALAAEDARSDIKAAAKKLAEKPNYAWTTTMKIDGAPGFRVGPTEGRTEKNGWTHTKASFNDTAFETLSKGGKGALKRDDEWKTVEELESDDRAAWMARRIKSFKTPAEEAGEIADKLKDAKLEQPGVWSGNMTEEGAKSIFSLGRRAGGGAPADAKGSAKFWAQDGVLSKFEFTVQGTVKRPDSDEESKVKRATTVEIKEVGSTMVALPEEVKKKLQ